MKDSFGKRFGRLVKRLRGEQGLTQPKLAIKAFDDEGKRSQITRLEKGYIDNPHQKTVDLLTVALDILPEDLAACYHELTPFVATRDWQDITGEFLPGPPDRFLGHSTALAEVEEFLIEPALQGLLVHGMGGVGKTALVIKALTDNIEFGQEQCFFLDVRGYETTSTEQDLLKSALTRLISRHSPTKVILPADNDQLIALWKQTSRAISKIIILDNVRTLAQLKALVPIGNTKWIATSRRMISGRHKSIGLKPLSDDLGGQLATRIVKQHSDNILRRECAVRLSELCEGLPLAIEVAAGTIACTPGLDLRAFFNQLESTHKAVASSEDWEEHVIKRLVVSLNYLNSDQRLVFSALSVFSGEFTQIAAQAVLPQSIEFSTVCARLTRNNMLQYIPRSGVSKKFYKYHDMMKAIAFRNLLKMPSADRKRLLVRFSEYFSQLIREYTNRDNHLDKNQPVPTIIYDIDNIRTAFENALSSDDEGAIERVITFISDDAVMQKLTLIEQLDWLEEAHDRIKNAGNQLGGDRHALTLGNIHITRAKAMSSMGDHQEAETLLRSVLDDAILSRIPSISALAWSELSLVLGNIPGRTSESIEAMARALKKVTESGEER